MPGDDDEDTMTVTAALIKRTDPQPAHRSLGSRQLGDHVVSHGDLPEEPLELLKG